MKMNIHSDSSAWVTHAWCWIDQSFLLCVAQFFLLWIYSEVGLLWFVSSCPVFYTFGGWMLCCLSCAF